MSDVVNTTRSTVPVFIVTKIALRTHQLQRFSTARRVAFSGWKASGKNLSRYVRVIKTRTYVW